MDLQALIVDDEFPAREELKCVLQEIGNIMIVGECEDGDEVVPFVQRFMPDIVFLDIQMRSKDGLAVAGEILEMSNPPYVVFSTGFSQYAVKAFELDAVDYILKPYSAERVAKCIEKIRNRKLAAAAESPVSERVTEEVVPEITNLCVWSKDRIVIVPPADVFFAKADENRQTMLHTTKGNFYTKMALKELEEILKKHRFLRTHKSYLVNLNRVNEVIPWFNNTYVLVLENCAEKNIPVARHYMKEFNRYMGIS
jgi:DNA-binding LytR/AlgR family response regulator